MARTVIDPISRIEGHLQAELEVDGGVVTDAWVCGQNFRGMELVVENRAPEDAAQIVQRMCGLCPVSHAHASAIAAEKARGQVISNPARIMRNIIEGAQILRSNLLWYYNLIGLDFINPLNAVNANVGDAYDAAKQYGTKLVTDLDDLKDRLSAFAKNGQLSVFSGNWFDAEGGTAYKFDPELDLVMTAHYFESLKFHAKIDELIAVIGGKMPHPVTLVPGGFLCHPTPGMMEDLRGRMEEIDSWLRGVIIPDAKAFASYYPEVSKMGRGVGRYAAWGVLEGPDWPYGEDYTEQMLNRYLPMGIVEEDFSVIDVEEHKIQEYVGHSWYKGDDVYTSPYFVTEPDYTGYDVNDRYTWVKCPSYDGKPHEVGSIARMFSAYKRGVGPIKELVDDFSRFKGTEVGDLLPFESVMGRIEMRAVEMTYVSKLMLDFIDEMIEVLKNDDLDDYFAKPKRDSGAGTGFWEAPRGALYHSETVENDLIQGYEIVIPTTWNLAPINQNGEHGPIEQALIGVPVEDLEKPINALRTVHSFDPCTACSVHVSEPRSGRSFTVVSNPWNAVRTGRSVR